MNRDHPWVIQKWQELQWAPFSLIITENCFFYIYIVITYKHANWLMKWKSFIFAMLRWSSESSCFFFFLCALHTARVSVIHTAIILKVFVWRISQRKFCTQFYSTALVWSLTSASITSGHVCVKKAKQCFTFVSINDESRYNFISSVIYFSSSLFLSAISRTH